MKYLRLLFVVFTMQICMSTNAYDFTAKNKDGITIYYNKLSENTCSVTRKSLQGLKPDYFGIIIIPESVMYFGKKYSVVSIDSFAFCNCEKLTSVSIPNSVIHIGHNTFDGCCSLESIFIPKSVTYIDSGAFRICDRLTAVHINDLSAWCRIEFMDTDSNPLSMAHNLYLNNRVVTTLTIPSDISTIKNYTFCGCSSLTSINMPNTVTSIGIHSFGNCI